MAYDEQQKYAKFLKKKHFEAMGTHGHDSGCPDCGCEDGCDDKDCGCCPVGLVAVYSDEGKHIACLSPNDAEEFQKNNFKCQDGYIKLYDNTGATPLFIGCVSETEFATLYPIVNP